MTVLHPHVLRSLEELLRRVLRSPEHGIDLAQVAQGTEVRVVRRRMRRDVVLAAALAGAAALVLMGMFLGHVLGGWGISG